MASCNTCTGTGRINSSDYEACGGCGGTGRMGASETCTYCDGSGKSSTPKRENCYSCGGSGIVRDPQPIINKPKTGNKNTSVKKNDGDALQKLIGFGVFIAVGIIVYQPEQENGIAATIAGVIAGIIAAVLYKLIAVVGVLLIAAYLYSNYGESGGKYNNSSSSTNTSNGTKDRYKNTYVPPKKTTPSTTSGLTINNKCRRDIRIAITIRDENRKWVTNAWWDFKGNFRSRLLYVNREAVKVSFNEVYLFAEIPNGNYEWSGQDHTATVEGRSLNMRKFVVSGDVESGYEVELSCPGK